MSFGSQAEDDRLRSCSRSRYPVDSHRDLAASRPSEKCVEISTARPAFTRVSGDTLLELRVLQRFAVTASGAF